MKLLLGLCVLLVSGCSSFMQPTGGMSADQIAAIVKDKNGNVLCISAVGPYGTYQLKNITLDSGVIKDGELQVSDDCKSVIIHTQAPPRAPVAPKEPAPVPAPKTP